MAEYKVDLKMEHTCEVVCSTELCEVYFDMWSNSIRLPIGFRYAVQLEHGVEASCLCLAIGMYDGGRKPRKCCVTPILRLSS